jgi:hypothetical protein
VRGTSGGDAVSPFRQQSEKEFCHTAEGVFVVMHAGANEITTAVNLNGPDIRQLPDEVHAGAATFFRVHWLTNSRYLFYTKKEVGNGKAVKINTPGCGYKDHSGTFLGIYIGLHRAGAAL